MEVQTLKTNTLSGALSINDTMIHSMINDLPFGGVGHSGMGRYHGQEGFDTFSLLKPIVVQSKLSLNHLLYPPYSKLAYFLLAKLSGIKLN
jgi:coniferyl-aldehyde dehydrogenase